MISGTFHSLLYISLAPALEGSSAQVPVFTLPMNHVNHEGNETVCLADVKTLHSNTSLQC